MALAPRTVQNMPDCLRREPTTALHPGFDNIRADKEMLAAELCVAHAGCIFLKVVGLDTNLLEDFRIGGVDGGQRENQLFDFSLVKESLLVDLHPDFLAPFVVGMQFAGDLPQVLAGVIEIDDLQRARKMQRARFQIHSAPSPMTTLLWARPQPRLQASR